INQNANQDAAITIAQNTADSAVSKNVAQDITIAANKADADSKNTAQNAVIKKDRADNAARDSEQDKIIAANKDAADRKAASQDSVIRFNSQKNEITAATVAQVGSQLNAEVSKLEDKNTKQDNIAASNNADSDARNYTTNLT